MSASCQAVTMVFQVVATVLLGDCYSIKDGCQGVARWSLWYSKCLTVCCFVDSTVTQVVAMVLHIQVARVLRGGYKVTSVWLLGYSQVVAIVFQVARVLLGDCYWVPDGCYAVAQWFLWYSQRLMCYPRWLLVVYLCLMLLCMLSLQVYQQSHTRARMSIRTVLRHVHLLGRDKGVLFDGHENVTEFDLGGESVAMIDDRHPIRPVPAVHCNTHTHTRKHLKCWYILLKPAQYQLERSPQLFCSILRSHLFSPICVI